MGINANLVREAAELMKAAKRITVFTGAGISAESGIKTYRDKDGVWNQVDIVSFGTVAGYSLNPTEAWRWNIARRAEMRRAEPNPAHLALSRLQKLRPNTSIITQNIDDLHERAANQNIIHLHGSAFGNYCFNHCKGFPTVIDPLPESEAEPPHCPYCDALIRPAVVWFGEMLPMDAVDAMRKAVFETDLLLVIGLSGAIHYGVPQHVRKAEGKVIEVNPNLSSITPDANIWLATPAGESVPALIAKLEEIS
jgi:NAD-dependent deacetylase